MSVMTTKDEDGDGPIVRIAAKSVTAAVPHSFDHALGDSVSVVITGTVIERTDSADGDKYWLEYPITHGRTARQWFKARDLVAEPANDV